MTEDRIVLAVCVGLVVVSAVGLALLRRPDSRLSRWLDREVDAATTLPGGRP